MKVAIVLGTRPEIIKLSPIIRACQDHKADFFILHTNQHYSEGMDRVFFKELKLPQPAYNLNVHNLTQGAMVGQMLIGIEPILLQEKPDWVLVQGDTNTVMAGAIAASKLGIKVGHVEAGLRSYDRSMPEEINRIIADHLSDVLFCPTANSAKIAHGEGIDTTKVVVTGNTIVEAVSQNLTIAKKSRYASTLPQSNYLLLTLHRPSNVDSKNKLSSLITALEALSADLNLPIYFPIHPRTAAALKHFALSIDENRIKILDPVGYLEMLLLMEKAQLILTDSGGIQEEACILRIPCVTLRDNTERPETITVGANILSGDPDKLLHSVRSMLTKTKNWENPLGPGNSSQRIVEFIFSYKHQKKSQP